MFEMDSRFYGSWRDLSFSAYQPVFDKEKEFFVWQKIMIFVRDLNLVKLKLSWNRLFPQDLKISLKAWSQMIFPPFVELASKTEYEVKLSNTLSRLLCGGNISHSVHDGNFDGKFANILIYTKSIFKSSSDVNSGWAYRFTLSTFLKSWKWKKKVS